jgi:hypothetical protein
MIKKYFLHLRQENNIRLPEYSRKKDTEDGRIALQIDEAAFDMRVTYFQRCFARESNKKSRQSRLWMFKETARIFQDEM